MVLKKKCSVLDDYQQVAQRFAEWTQLEPTVEVNFFHQHFFSEDEIVEAVSDCEILVIMRERTPFRASIFKRLPNLKLLVTSGMRNASVDIIAAKEHGVTVCGTGNSSDAPTELAWALILGLARHLVCENHAIKNGGPWQSTVGTELYGKQLGLVGLGKIGARMAKVGQAFGMRIAAWSPNLTVERATATGAECLNKEDLFASSDIVSMHMILSDRTRHLVKQEDFMLMRKTSLFINTSRSGLVDTAALIAALENNSIAGAGLDVFDVEPLPASNVLRSLPNVLATPHLGYVTDSNYKKYFADAVENILSYLQGSVIRRID